MSNEYNFNHNYENFFNLYSDRIKTLKYNTKNNNFEFELKYNDQNIYYSVDNNFIYLNSVSLSESNTIVFSLNNDNQPLINDKYEISTNKFSINDQMINLFDYFNNNKINIGSNNWTLKYNNNKTVEIVQQIKNTVNTTNTYLLDFNDINNNNIYLILKYSIPQDKDDSCFNYSIPKYNIDLTNKSPPNNSEISFNFYKKYFTNSDSSVNKRADYDMYSSFGKTQITDIEYSLDNGFTLTSYSKTVYNYNALKLNYNILKANINNNKSFADKKYTFLYDNIYLNENINSLITYDSICYIDNIKYDFDCDVNNKKIIYIDKTDNNLLNLEFEYIPATTSCSININTDLTYNFNQNDYIFNDKFVYIKDKIDEKIDYNIKIGVKSDTSGLLFFDSNNTIVNKISLFYDNDSNININCEIIMSNYIILYNQQNTSQFDITNNPNNIVTYSYINGNLNKQISYSQHFDKSEPIRRDFSFTFIDSINSEEFNKISYTNDPPQKEIFQYDYIMNLPKGNLSDIINQINYDNKNNTLDGYEIIIKKFYIDQLNLTVNYTLNNNKYSLNVKNASLNGTINGYIINYNGNMLLYCKNITGTFYGTDETGNIINSSIEGDFSQTKYNIANYDNVIKSGGTLQGSLSFTLVNVTIQVKDKILNNNNNIILLTKGANGNNYILALDYLNEIINKFKNIFKKIEFCKSTNTIDFYTNSDIYYSINYTSKKLSIKYSEVKENDFKRKYYLHLSNLFNFFYSPSDYKKIVSRQNKLIFYFGEFNEKSYIITNNTTTQETNIQFVCDFSIIPKYYTSYSIDHDIFTFSTNGFKLIGTTTAETKYENSLINKTSVNTTNQDTIPNKANIINKILINNTNQIIYIYYDYNYIIEINTITYTVTVKANIYNNQITVNKLIFNKNKIYLSGSLNNNKILELDTTLLTQINSFNIDTVLYDYLKNIIQINLSNNQFIFSAKLNSNFYNFPITNVKTKIDLTNTNMKIYDDIFNINNCNIDNGSNFFNYNVMSPFAITNNILLFIEYDLTLHTVTYTDNDNNLYKIILNDLSDSDETNILTVNSVNYVMPYSNKSIKKITSDKIIINVHFNKLLLSNTKRTYFFLNYEINQNNLNFSEKNNFKSVANANFFGNVLTIIDYLTYVYINLDNPEYLNIDKYFFINFVCGQNVLLKIDNSNNISVDNDISKYKYDDCLLFYISDIVKSDFSGKNYYLQVESDSTNDLLNTFYYRCISNTITDSGAAKFIIDFLNYLLKIDNKYINQSLCSPYYSYFVKDYTTNNKTYNPPYPLILEVNQPIISSYKQYYTFIIPLPDDSPTLNLNDKNLKRPSVNFIYSTYSSSIDKLSSKFSFILSLTNCNDYKLDTTYGFKSDKLNLQNLMVDINNNSNYTSVSDITLINGKNPLKFIYNMNNLNLELTNINNANGHLNEFIINILSEDNTTDKTKLSTLLSHTINIIVNYNLRIPYTTPSKNIKTMSVDIQLTININYKYNTTDDSKSLFDITYNYKIINNSFYLSTTNEYINYETTKNNEVNIIIPRYLGYNTKKSNNIVQSSIFYNNIFRDYVHEFYINNDYKMIISFNKHFEKELIKNNFLIIIEYIAYMLSFLCDISLDNNSLATKNPSNKDNYILSSIKPFKYDIFKDKIVQNDKSVNLPLLHFAWSYYDNIDEILYCVMLSKSLSINFFNNTIKTIFNLNCKSNDIFENGLLKFAYSGKNINITNIFGSKNKTNLSIDSTGIHSYLTNLLNYTSVYPMYGTKSLYDNNLPIVLKNSDKNSDKKIIYPQNILDMFNIAQQIDPLI